ncbi:hypothetical protein DICVIV_09894 [Dictyocaulus viviparus]|uniref:Small ribosomal subunit protein mS31 n=1 Tax=Dictyocaulus viviparus TaxID=29172 RepID=A0A0D8XJR4_DICVI|nr:hypothetical protein DICVIV_09894 [Dictyocaulus viviparus]
MFKRLLPRRRVIDQVIRSLSNEHSGDSKKNSGVSYKDALGDELLNAVDSVVDDLHVKDAVAKKAAKNSLITKLMSYERETFHEATAAQMQEMLNDKRVLALLNSVAADAGKAGAASITGARIRHERRALLLLRREVFYQALQSGMKSSEARSIAEKAVAEAHEKLTSERKSKIDQQKTAEKEYEKKEVEKTEREQKLYDYALHMAEKMLFHDEILGDGTETRKSVGPDPNAPSLLKGTKRLGIFKSMEDLREKSLGFWSDWNLRAAKIFNQSLGPENSFEEQIEWTKGGKQWPYPIDNEFMIGPEAEVPFYDHIFLERHLPGLGIPKDGPIAHFMELVCVGLSKNPYMTVTKKNGTSSMVRKLLQ